MGQLSIDQRSRTPWIAALALTTVAVAAAVWYHGHEDQEASAVAPMAASGTAQASSSPAQAADLSAPPSSAVIANVMEQQQAATQAIVAQPKTPAITRAPTERPDFVSPMEWTMLKGVAQQSANPDQELLRLVNKLKFTKQLELWQDAPKTAETAVKRQALASQLLEDLPSRVAQGDMELAEARKLQTALINDAEPDPNLRRTRSASEDKRLTEQARSTPSAPR